MEPVELDVMMLIGKLYVKAQARTYNELPVALARCPACGADIDEACIGQYNRRHAGSLHADRRVAAEAWRKSNKAEYYRLKEDLIKLFLAEEYNRQGTL